MSNITFKDALLMFVLYVIVSAFGEMLGCALRAMKRKIADRKNRKNELKVKRSPDSTEEGDSPEGGGRNVPDAVAPERAPRPSVKDNIPIEEGGLENE